MALSRKKVLIRKLDSTVCPGYLNAAGIVGVSGGVPAVELLDLQGRAQPIELRSIRWIAYVREFNLDDPEDPERLLRRTFLARPRSEGLWIRLTLAGGESLEGLAPLDLALLDGLLDDRGLFLIPPDIRSNTQRLYVPRTAITRCQVVAVITTPSKPRTAPRMEERRQPELLFPDLPED